MFVFLDAEFILQGLQGLWNLWNRPAAPTARAILQGLSATICKGDGGIPWTPMLATDLNKGKCGNILCLPPQEVLVLLAKY